MLKHAEKRSSCTKDTAACSDACIDLWTTDITSSRSRQCTQGEGDDAISVSNMSKLSSSLDGDNATTRTDREMPINTMEDCRTSGLICATPPSSRSTNKTGSPDKIPNLSGATPAPKLSLSSRTLVMVTVCFDNLSTSK